MSYAFLRLTVFEKELLMKLIECNRFQYSVRYQDQIKISKQNGASFPREATSTLPSLCFRGEARSMIVWFHVGFRFSMRIDYLCFIVNYEFFFSFHHKNQICANFHYHFRNWRVKIRKYTQTFFKKNGGNRFSELYPK